MKKYELKKCSAEFAWKERKEIKEGGTIHDVEPEKIGEFESLEKAEEELTKYETEISESGGLFSVTEYMIQENEYDDEDEWIDGGDVWSFSKMEIEIVDNETLELIGTAKSYEEAEKIAEDYEGEAGVHLML